MSKTIQTREKFQVHLESVWGYDLNGEKNSSIMYYLKQPIEVKGDVYETYVSLSSFVCPISFYVVNENNDLLELEENGILRTVNITHGNYNINQLITEIKSQLPSNWDIQINLNTYKLSIINTTYQFYLLSSSTCWRILGFNKNTTYSSNIGITYPTIELPNVINLLGTTMVKIWCPTLSLNNIDGKTGGKAPILASVVANDINGGVLIYNNYTQFKCICKEKVFTQFQIDLKDEFDEYLNLSGCDYSIVLEVEYFYEKEIKKDTFMDIVNNLGNN